MSARAMVVVVVGLAAVIEDLSRRRVSNLTSGGALLAGVALHFAQKGWAGAMHSVFGAVIGFSVFLIFYVLGGMGGGDVKLMAGFGALLSDHQILPAALLAAIAGGLMAVVYLGVRAVARRIWPRVCGKACESIPYAPAITAGVWLAIVSEM